MPTFSFYGCWAYGIWVPQPGIKTLSPLLGAEFQPLGHQDVAWANFYNSEWLLSQISIQTTEGLIRQLSCKAFIGNTSKISFLGTPLVGPVVKNLPANAGDTGSIPDEEASIHHEPQPCPCATMTKPKL